jgi:hypothetical protein
MFSRPDSSVGLLTVMGSSHGQAVSGGFTTDTCLIHLTDCIKFEMDKWQYCLILWDLQRAIDTVDHTILHMKKFFFFSFMKLHVMTFLHGLSLISAAGGCGWYSFYYCSEYLWCPPDVHFRSSFMSNVCQWHVCDPKQ